MLNVSNYPHKPVQFWHKPVTHSVWTQWRVPVQQLRHSNVTQSHIKAAVSNVSPVLNEKNNPLLNIGSFFSSASAHISHVILQEVAVFFFVFQCLVMSSTFFFFFNILTNQEAALGCLSTDYKAQNDITFLRVFIYESNQNSSTKKIAYSTFKLIKCWL